jgi:ATP-binding cassette subfamily B (MDR/TAP) protein 1
MWWGTRLYTHEQIPITSLFACIEAVIMAGASASRLFSFVPDIARASQAFTLMMQWDERVPQIDALPLVTDDLSTVEGSVRFTDCTLKYPTRPGFALNGLNLEIKAGQNVAFCGPSGGGKTSILALLNRFYDPTSGTIHIDGMDIRSLPLDQYRKCLALVSQDAILYEGTFRDNICLGISENVTQEELEQACREAHILDFIQSLPDGFDTQVGIKGAQMSGGQRQRICIARALLRKPKILLLDEATSALDSESEKAVQQALNQVSKGRTTITIAHRLSTIQGADVIHVVEHGRIIESGSHDDLLARRGRYYDLVRAQME